MMLGRFFAGGAALAHHQQGAAMMMRRVMLSTSGGARLQQQQSDSPEGYEQLYNETEQNSGQGFQPPQQQYQQQPGYGQDQQQGYGQGQQQGYGYGQQKQGGYGQGQGGGGAGDQYQTQMQRRFPARGINRVELLGGVGADPQFRQTVNGSNFASFNLYTNVERKMANGESYTSTEVHNVICFGGLAKYVANVITKGSRVYVTGRLHYSGGKPQATGGYSARIASINVDGIYPLAKRSPSQQNGGGFGGGGYGGGNFGGGDNNA